jgi:hypothetical protein
MPRQKTAAKSRVRKVSLLPRGPYARFTEVYSRMALALAGAGKSISDLSQNRERIYWDLREPFHEHAIGDLYEWWNYDQPKLLQRAGRRHRAKPRIVLNAIITRPGNFSLEWTPDSLNGGDWTHFHRTSGYGPYRPSNELMFIRGVRGLNPNPKPDQQYGTQHDPLVDAHLLACLGAAVSSLENRLKISFEVRWESKLVLDWEPDSADAWGHGPDGHPLLGWHIEDVVGRSHREEQSELEALLAPTQRDAAGFVALLLELQPDLTLDRLRTETTRVRLQKKLRERGITITPAPLARLVKLLEDQHAELLRPLWRSVGGGALQVVK